METRSRLQSALDGLRRELSAPGGMTPTDSELLTRFLTSRDEAAFALLVRRHGPLVLSVCRRVLRQEQDAEDAFQATFLVLARRAAAVRKREALASFLYGVAYRTALEARAVQARRQAREKQVEELPHPAVEAEEPHDWRHLLDRELDRLPEKYRSAIVLCDLQGLPRKEAARRLGVPEGTLSSRLAAGRRRLAQRLSRRGVVLSAVALATVLAEAAPAAVPSSLTASTMRAAVLTMAVSPTVTLLMKGVLRSMYLAKVKIVAGVVLILALAAGGMVYRSQHTQAASDKPAADKPVSEVDALRRENELLRLNLRVVLEKLHAQEKELQALRAQAGDKQKEARSAAPARRSGDKNPPPEVEGQVRALDSGGQLVTLSIGSDAGLARGHTLEVFRLSPTASQNKYLGTLRIIEVQPHKAVAQPMGRLMAPLQVGDRVASRILAGH
jgi:RNA polymerase sigma factor (sigma-70 family)